MKKIPFNESFFAVDTERSFYWAGFLAADGCVSEWYQKGSLIQAVKLTQAERYVIVAFLSDVECFGRKISERHYDKVNGHGVTYNIELKSSKMFGDLHRFGILPRKSKLLTMPGWLTNHRLVNHFLRGYFDGDGSVYINKNQICMDFRGTIEFLNSVSLVLRENGLCTAAVPHIHSGCGSLKVAGNRQSLHVADFMYRDATIWLKRKRDKFTINSRA